MTFIKLKHVDRFRFATASGVTIFGCTAARIPLRGDPGSTEFIESYQAAERGEAQREPEAKLRGASGTFDRLTHEYFAMASVTLWRIKSKDAGLPERCVTHGLHKAATRRLAEAGCSANEIAAITGHATLVEVSRYTKAAEQKSLAKAAIRRLQRSQSITDSQTFPRLWELSEIFREVQGR